MVQVIYHYNLAIAKVEADINHEMYPKVSFLVCHS